MDFTIALYHTLIKTLHQQGFSFLSFSDFVSEPLDRVIVLRHDVDKLPFNSLRFARIQADKGIIGSYYFRFVQESFNESIIREISSLGHEIGYHYETMDTCKGNLGQAYNLFCENLEKLRKVVPVNTICMHGSPMSKWDSRLLWKYYDYRDFGITGEPYFDINFNEVLYLTDTGRRWNGGSVSIRDKASGIGHQASGDNPYKDWKVKPFSYRTEIKKNNIPPSPPPALPPSSSKFHSTADIIKAALEGRLPDRIMMTFHPQRWTDRPIPWVKELVWQNVKNAGKYFLVKTR